MADAVRAASERRGSTLKGLNGFYLEAKAKTWHDCLICAMFARRQSSKIAATPQDRRDRSRRYCLLLGAIPAILLSDHSRRFDPPLLVIAFPYIVQCMGACSVKGS